MGFAMLWRFVTKWKDVTKDVTKENGVAMRVGGMLWVALLYCYSFLERERAAYFCSWYEKHLLRGSLPQKFIVNVPKKRNT